MEIHGRDVNFRRTILATCEVAEMSPDGDVNKFDKLLTSKEYAKSQKAAAAFVAALSKGYEMAREWEEPGYKGRPLTAEEVLSLDDAQFESVFVEALRAWTGDATITIETEPVKGKGKNADGDSE